MIGVGVSNPPFKVTVSNTGGFNAAFESPSSTNVILTEQYKYLDVKGIKPSPFDDFCIVTLAKPVVYSYRVAPLCLPVMQNKEYDREGEPGQEGTVLGFGYDDIVAVYADQQFKESKMTERKIAKSTFQIISAKNCRELSNSGNNGLEMALRSAEETGRVYGRSKYAWLELYVYYNILVSSSNITFCFF